MLLIVNHQAFLNVNMKKFDPHNYFIYHMVKITFLP
ncbi:hypothetical protein DFO53_1380 [Enterobacter sp. AG5470]|nr:hypothetical protein DFO53_1380 [Enterobacter sp. AG5470]